MTPSLEFRIPIAPTPAFYSNIRLAAASLAKLGEPYASARIVVSVGYGADREAILAANPWSHRYPIDWHPVSPEIWGRGGFESGLFGDRFPRTTTGDIVIHIDADACVVDRFDKLLDALSAPRPRAAGCMAHFPPFRGLTPQGNELRWKEIFRACGVEPPPFLHAYSLGKPEEFGMAPPYFNAGFVAVNRAAWEAAMPAVDKHTPAIRALLHTYGRAVFAVQYAMAVALVEQNIETILLGLEYNCPNDDAVLRFGLSDLRDVKVIHYLRQDEFNRHTFVATDDAAESFLGADLAGAVNRKLQAHIRSVMTVRP